MRYKSRKDLPKYITDVLPEDAQQVYMEAYNRVWDEYDGKSGQDLSRHSLAHRQAWEAIQAVMVQDQGTGAWHHKGEPDTVEEGKPKSFLEKAKDAIAGVFS
jgi:cation transport regulator